MREDGRNLFEENERLLEENERLQRSVAELVLLNEVATALGTARDLDTVLRRIVRSAVGAVGAGQGTVTLVGPAEAGAARTAVRTSVGSSERSAFRPSEVLLGWMHWYRRPIRIADPQADPRVNEGSWDPAVRSVLSVPLLVRNALVGVLTVYNKHGAGGAPAEGGFTDEDERLLAILAAQSAQVVENARVAAERDRVRQAFGQHTSPAIVEAVLERGEDGPRRLPVAVLALEIRGVAAFAERAEPEAVLDHLNALLWVVIESVNRHHGTVNQLSGDGLLVLFGAPVPGEHDARNAVRAAFAIAERLRTATAAGALPSAEVGIGVHEGEVVAGLVGSRVHREYRAVGDAVHLAKQVASQSEALGATVLATEAVRAAVGDEMPPSEPLGAVEIPGRSTPVALYRLA